MNIKGLTVGDFETNCFILWGSKNEAIVIDPGSDADQIKAFLKKNRLSVCSYMLTHGHVDHISALADLHKAMPAPVGIHGSDLKWAFNAGNQMLPFYDTPVSPPKIERVFKDGEKFTDGDLDYSVIFTPGHTEGSVCFLFHKENVLFSGDTLFAGSVGRTDLPGGSSRTLTQSLKKIAGLDENTVIYPGHGPQTNLKHEKKHNFFMQSLPKM